MAAKELYITTLYNDANLVAYYRCENVNDSKGSRTLTNAGTTTFAASVFNNGATQGTSNSTKYLYRDSDNYGITGGALTLIGWIKILTLPGSGSIVQLLGLGDATTNTRLLLAYKNNGGTPQIFVERFKGPATEDFYVTNNDLGTTNYHLLAVTYNGTTVTAYVDGSAIGSPVSSSGNGSSGVSSRFDMGCSQAGGSLSSAFFDDVAVFSRALSATEISNIYTGSLSNRGLGGPFLFNMI